MPEPGDPNYVEDRFADQQNKNAQAAVFGQSADDLWANYSKGQDWTLEDKMSILQEYWSLIRVNGVFLLGMAFAFAIFSVMVISLYDLPYYFGESRGLETRLGGLLFGIGIGALIGKFIPHGNKECIKEAPGVDRNYEGRTCIEDSQCTLSNNIVEGACAYPPSSTIMIIIRWTGYLSFIAGLILMVVAGRKGMAEGAGALCKDPELPCKKGLVCDKGACKVKPDCKNDMECPGGFVCSEKQCMAKGAARKNDLWLSAFIGYGFGYTINYFLGH